MRGICRFTRRPVVRSSRKSFWRGSPRGASCRDRADVIPDSREVGSWVPSVSAARARVPAFFGWNARNRLISRRRSKEKKKKGEGRRWTNERTNQGSSGSCCAAEEEKEEKKARDSRRRSRSLASPHDSYTLRGSASVVLVPCSHWSAAKRTNKRDRIAPFLSLSCPLCFAQSGELDGRKGTSKEGRSEVYTRDTARARAEGGEKQRKETIERTMKNDGGIDAKADREATRASSREQNFRRGYRLFSISSFLCRPDGSSDKTL